MAESTPTQLDEATWASIIDAAQQETLPDLLKQLLSDDTYTTLQSSGLHPRASSDEVISVLRKVPVLSQDLVLLHILLATAAIHDDSNLFKYQEEGFKARGISVLPYLHSLVYKVPEVFIFLAQLDWKGLGSNREAVQQFLSVALETHPAAERPKSLHWLSKINGIPTEKDWVNTALHVPAPEVLAYLLKLHPNGILNYGMLQRAVAGGNVDLTRKLVEAGADVNLDPPVYGFNDMREAGSPYRPLWTIALFSKYPGMPGHMELKMEAARILLEHGADVHLPGHGTEEGLPVWYSALELARKNGHTALIKLYEQYQDRNIGAARSSQDKHASTES